MWVKTQNRPVVEKIYCLIKRVEDLRESKKYKRFKMSESNSIYNGNFIVLATRKIWCLRMR